MQIQVDSGESAAIGFNTKRRAVVIGAGFGGLSSAMRLGAKGYRVTVIDKLDCVGGRGSQITMEGHRFDLGPTIVTLPAVFRDLWAATGRDFDADVDLRALDPFYEIRFDDGSHLAACSDTKRMKAEIERLNPADLSGYAAFLKDSERRYEFGWNELGRKPMAKIWHLIRVLHKFGWLRADRSVYSHVAKRFRDERLRMAFSFHPLFIGGDPFHVTSMYTLVSHLEKEFGVHYAMGGTVAIAKAMAGVIEEQGGSILLETCADRILVEGRRARGVKTTDGRVLPADVVVSNADPAYTYKHLLKGVKRRRWTDGHLDSRRWSMGLFVWYFGTRGTRQKWADVGHHTILNGPRYKGLVKDIFIRGKLADDMSLYVHRPSVTDPTAAPDGGDTFYALSPVPHLGFEDAPDWEAIKESYRQKVAKVLNARLIPGFEEHLSASMIFTPEDFRERYLSPYGSGFSIEPRILQSAWFRPHNVSEELDGLYIAGAGTHPGAGLPGVVASGEVVASLVPDAVDLSL